MIEPDAWISIHTVDDRVVGPGVVGHSFGPFLSLDELRKFELGRKDGCVKTVIGLFLPPNAGIKGVAIDAAMSELMVLGALAMNWLNTTHGDSMGHDHHCPLTKRGLEVGDLEQCTCGWSTFYAKFLDLQSMSRVEEASS